MRIMKNHIVLSVLALCFYFVTVNGSNCQLEQYDKEMDKKWSEMVSTCTALVKKQIQMEIEASMTYLALGTHFSRDTINRPGFAEFFFKSASEERQHAIKLIEYLLMRGQLVKDFNDLIKLSAVKINLAFHKITAIEALKEALKLETKVTASIKEMMDECEEPNDPNKDNNDFHLVDYLTTEFLEEQYKGQRDLAGKISTLGKMIMKKGENRALAEFLFDKKLLKGEV